MSTGDLLLRVECYVAVRKALGYGCRSEEKLLNNFVRFLELNGASGPIRAQTAIEWSVRQHMDLHRPDRPTGYEWCAVSCPISKPSSLRPRCLVRECCHPSCGLCRISTHPMRSPH